MVKINQRPPSFPSRLTQIISIVALTAALTYYFSFLPFFRTPEGDLDYTRIRYLLFGLVVVFIFVISYRIYRFYVIRSYRQRSSYPIVRNPKWFQLFLIFGSFLIAEFGWLIFSPRPQLVLSPSYLDQSTITLIGVIVTAVGVFVTGATAIRSDRRAAREEAARQKEEELKQKATEIELRRAELAVIERKLDLILLEKETPRRRSPKQLKD